jgi:hypothetical protein
VRSSSTSDGIQAAAQQVQGIQKHETASHYDGEDGPPCPPSPAFIVDLVWLWRIRMQPLIVVHAPPAIAPRVGDELEAPRFRSISLRSFARVGNRPPLCGARF